MFLIYVLSGKGDHRQKVLVPRGSRRTLRVTFWCEVLFGCLTRIHDPELI